MIAAVLAAAVLTGCLVASSAFAADADILREAIDRADIAQLMWNYCRALDTFTAALKDEEASVRRAAAAAIADVTDTGHLRSRPNPRPNPNPRPEPTPHPNPRQVVVR